MTQTTISASTPTIISASTLVSVYTRTAEAVTQTAKPSYIIGLQHRTTISGSVVTQLVTLTPSPLPPAPPEQYVAQPTNSGISKGGVAGITIASIVAVAGLGFILWFFCWKRRREQQMQDGQGGGVHRNTSVLSKVGLLASENQVQEPREPPQATLPRIRTSGINPDGGLDSAATFISSMSEFPSRRISRPMFSDNRLNPNALMVHQDLSRTSISTLQDNRDYSRPLEIRNPDSN